jgi:hypothetical protein
MESHEAGFPPFPHSLEIPSGLPHSHGLDGWIYVLSYPLNSNHRHRKGLVTDVSGPQRNACPGTLRAQPPGFGASRAGKRSPKPSPSSAFSRPPGRARPTCYPPVLRWSTASRLSKLPADSPSPSCPILDPSLTPCTLLTTPNISSNPPSPPPPKSPAPRTRATPPPSAPAPRISAASSLPTWESLAPSPHSPSTSTRTPPPLRPLGRTPPTAPSPVLVQFEKPLAGFCKRSAQSSAPPCSVPPVIFLLFRNIYRKDASPLFSGATCRASRYNTVRP